MPKTEITERTIREIKRHARKLSRVNANLTYMQHLDASAREMAGVRHFHEARQLAARRRQPIAPAVISPLLMYLQACQESYFET